MEWAGWLVADRCPCGCRPLPDRMRDCAAEHDMAESGKRSLAVCMGAKV